MMKHYESIQIMMTCSWHNLVSPLNKMHFQNLNISSSLMFIKELSKKSFSALHYAASV